MFIWFLGRSYNNDDANIGIVWNYLCDLSLPDFETFKKQLIIDAFAKNNQAHCDVEQLIGIVWPRC